MKVKEIINAFMRDDSDKIEIRICDRNNNFRQLFRKTYETRRPAMECEWGNSDDALFSISSNEDGTCTLVVTSCTPVLN